MRQGMAGNSFFIELRKRKVFQTAAVCIAVAWGATEFAPSHVARALVSC
jgi:hypothetical protein